MHKGDGAGDLVAGIHEDTRSQRIPCHAASDGKTLIQSERQEKSTCSGADKRADDDRDRQHEDLDTYTANVRKNFPVQTEIQADEYQQYAKAHGDRKAARFGHPFNAECLEKIEISAQDTDTDADEDHDRHLIDAAGSGAVFGGRGGICRIAGPAGCGWKGFCMAVTIQADEPAGKMDRYDGENENDHGENQSDQAVCIQIFYDLLVCTDSYAHRKDKAEDRNGLRLPEPAEFTFVFSQRDRCKVSHDADSEIEKCAGHCFPRSIEVTISIIVTKNRSILNANMYFTTGNMLE